MRKIKFTAALLVAPLLIACGAPEVDFNFNAPTIDVDAIDVSSLSLKRDTLTGEIAGNENEVFFDFYEVSDYHGAVNYSVEDETIGLARMGDYFKKKRALNPGGTIVLSSGDMYQGSAESNLTHGYIVNYAMNIMGFESMTLGNHEFDWTIDWLRKEQALKVEDHAIPYLGANIFDKSTGKILDFLAPSVTITRGDYKVGIVGTMGDGADSAIMKSLVEGLEFKAELAIAKAEAAKLKEEGCDIVVWSSHKDVSELSSYGSLQTSGIDVVFGGHSHKNSPAEGEEPVVIDGVPYLETKNYGKGIAHARVTLDKATKEVKGAVGEVDTKPYALAGLEEHAEVKKVMDLYNEYIDPIKHKVIGNVDAELDVSDTFSLTNLCVDTMALAANKWGKDNGDIKVVASFHNAKGGVRANMPAGEITFGSVYKSFPFDNEICVVKTTGKKLKNYFNKAGNYGVWIDLSRIAKTDSIDDAEEYYFVTTDFMATSSSFAFKLKDSDLMRTGYIVRDAVAARIQSNQNIKAASFVRSGNAQFSTPSK